MIAQPSTALERAAGGSDRTSIDIGIERIADMLQTIGQCTSAAQINNFIQMLWSRLHTAAGGQLNDRDTQLLEQMAVKRRNDLVTAREQRLPPTRSWFPIRKKSEKSREQAASGPRNQSRWERKRRMSRMSALPPSAEFDKFTPGECATLHVIATEMQRHGRCGITVGEMADRAGVGCTTVRNAIRKAKEHGLIRVTHRPQWRNKWLANIINIISDAWLAWLPRFRPGLKDLDWKGVKKAPSTDTYGKIIQMDRQSHQSNGGSTTRFQRFASRKPPSD